MDTGREGNLTKTRRKAAWDPGKAAGEGVRACGAKWGRRMKNDENDRLSKKFSENVQKVSETEILEK